MCCESNTGYLWRFIIYTGADTIYKEPNINVHLLKPFSDYTGPSRVVLSLIDGMYNQGYKVVLDNLYTSPELFRVFLENGTDAFGTLRRKYGLPPDFWDWKPPKLYLTSLPPIVQYCGNIMACRWNDCYKSKKTKIVSMLSTKHTGDLVGSGKMHYASKKEIVKPNVILDYNKCIDNLSRVLNPYSCQRKTVKWYRKIAELFLDISVYNSFVVWRELNESKDTHLDFRIKLIYEIITCHSYTKGKNNRHGPRHHKQPLRLVERHFIRQMSQVPKKTLLLELRNVKLHINARSVMLLYV